MTDDAQLLARIRAGATEEFAEVVRRHQDHIFAVLYRYERDPHRLEDLAQETFVKAWRALDQYDGRAPLEHWLTRIAVRTALDHWRKQKRRRAEVAFDELGEGAQDWLAGGDDEKEIAAGAAREILDAALSLLAPNDRMIIVLQEIEGRSVKEIAALIGVSGVAVRVRALRARARLKAAVEKLERNQS